MNAVTPTKKKAPCERFVREISNKVYRIRLTQDSGPNAVANMIGKDGDAGLKLNNRAGAYDGLTRVYLQAMEIEG